MYFFKLIEVHFLVSEIYIYQNARCNNKKNKKKTKLSSSGMDQIDWLLAVRL